MRTKLSFSILVLSFVTTASFAADSQVNGKWSVVQEGNEGCPTKLEVSCSSTEVRFSTSRIQSFGNEESPEETYLDSESFTADVGSKTSGYHTITGTSEARNCVRSESETGSYMGGGAETLRITDGVKLRADGILVYTHHVSTWEDSDEVNVSCTYQRE